MDYRAAIEAALRRAQKNGITKISDVADKILEYIEMAEDFSPSTAQSNMGGGLTGSLHLGSAINSFGGAATNQTHPQPLLVMPSKEEVAALTQQSKRYEIDEAIQREVQRRIQADSREVSTDALLMRPKGPAGDDDFKPKWTLDELQSYVMSQAPATISFIPKGAVAPMTIFRSVTTKAQDDTAGGSMVSLTYKHPGVDLLLSPPSEVFNVMNPRDSINMAETIKQITASAVVAYGQKTITPIPMQAQGFPSELNERTCM